MMRRFSQSAVLALLMPAVAAAQGFLVHTHPDHVVPLPRPIIIRPIPSPRPIPPSSYKIKELSVQTKLADQVARVQVSQTFVNTGSRQMEVCFVFPLPYDGAIDRLTLLVDGKEYEARLLEKKEARGLYESIVRKNQDPALLEWMGTGLFKTSVFPVPAGASRTVSLRYSQLCRQSNGLTDFMFPLSTAKYTSHPVEKVNIQVSIESADRIKNVYSPTHSIEIKRPDDEHATIAYSVENKVPTSDFRLLYDVGRGKVSTKVVSYRPDESADGYFLMLATPEIKAENQERPRKTVVFVVDRSGSMSGKKIVQAKSALKFVLGNLREGDLFNIVAYDSEVESFRPELQKYDKKSRAAAAGFVEGIFAGGGTNIDGALATTLSQLADSHQPTYVLFLTDGLPTIGEVNESKIVANAKSKNKVRARVFSFGVGYDVNSRLLDKLTVASRGQSEYVKPDEDIEEHVSRLYNKIGSPVLTDVAIKFDVEGAKPENGSPVSRIYPADSYDLFAGEQLVVVGRYKHPGGAKVTVSGHVGEKETKLSFPADFVKSSSDETFAFVEKLWAVRRIGEIIDELDLHGENKELIDELVSLSTQHGVLTPYTTFLADETSDVRDVAANAIRTRQALGRLQEVAGQGAFAQRRLKGAFKNADRAPADAEIAAPLADAAPALAAKAPAGANLGGGIGAGGEGKSSQLAVMNVGRKSFYHRGGRWVDAKVTAEMEKKPVAVKRFSKAYFDLIDKHGKDIAKYLAIEGAVVIELDGKAYAF
jgi:Ca-activated chloride channel family protein